MGLLFIFLNFNKKKPNILMPNEAIINDIKIGRVILQLYIYEEYVCNYLSFELHTSQLTAIGL